MIKYARPYQEQLARIERLYDELHKYNEATNENFEKGIDAFTSFFIQCYHLADWLKKSGYSENIVYGYIKKSPYLSLCHELANAQKHGKPHTHNKKKDSKFCDFGAYDMFGITTPISRHIDHIGDGRTKFCIHAADFGPFPLDVMELAHQCVKEWQNFLKTSPDPRTPFQPPK